MTPNILDDEASILFNSKNGQITFKLYKGIYQASDIVSRFYDFVLDNLAYFDNNPLSVQLIADICRNRIAFKFVNSSVVSITISKVLSYMLGFTKLTEAGITINNKNSTVVGNYAPYITDNSKFFITTNITTTSCTNISVYNTSNNNRNTTSINNILFSNYFTSPNSINRFNTEDSSPVGIDSVNLNRFNIHLKDGLFNKIDLQNERWSINFTII
jgi:hypothetical protein